MTIEIYCECGQQILAQDQFAGRKVRCSACERILKLPKDPQTAEKPPIVVKPEVRQAPEPAPAPVVSSVPVAPPKADPVPMSQPIPAAKTMTAVPTASAPATMPDAADPALSAEGPEAPGNLLELSCLCGKEYWAHREDAGEPTKCPHCGDILFIPNVA